MFFARFMVVVKTDEPAGCSAILGDAAAMRAGLAVALRSAGLTETRPACDMRLASTAKAYAGSANMHSVS